ncbi:MAG: zinc-dependent metalloprotease [Actinomycetota bacterium]|nr:zinc-dependent metalloprotease [Actinomycetota bacterium]
MQRAIPRLTAACAAGLLLATLGSTSQAAPDRPEPHTASGFETLLEKPAHGEEAITRLGSAITQAAARNELSTRGLKRLLRTDPAVWLDVRGRVYYIDSFADPAQASAAAAAPYPYDQTFSLHSNPSSSKKVFLDFDGHLVSGSAWNDDAGVGTQRQPAFDTSGDPSVFTEGERDRIQSMWQRVSEDYAPFDVDITTEDPGVDGLRRTSEADASFGMRALITPSESAATAICGAGCGGVAYLGIYNLPDNYAPAPSYYQPAWIFSHRLGNSDTKAVAETVSHEVGHTLGLDHDGFASTTTGYDYYAGHGAWAPIMGNSYNKPITQWSSGEYGAGANPEEDLSVIKSHGLDAMPDEAGDTRATAASLTGGTTLRSEGIISHRDDADFYSIARSCADPLTVTVAPAPTSANLDIKVTVFTADGTPLGSDDPPSAFVNRDIANGLAASLTAATTAGTYYIKVDGVGFGNPASDGYSDYASLGRYTVAANGCGDVQPDPPATAPGAPGIGEAVPGATGGKITGTAVWRPPASDGGSPVTGYKVTGLRMSTSGAVLSRTVSGIRPATSRSYAMVLPRLGKYRFTVRAVNAVGTGTASARSNKVAGR